MAQRSMRLFVALVPSQQIGVSLQNLQAEARGSLPRHSHSDERKADADRILTPHSPWRLSRAEDMHLTLEFLGDGITHHKSDNICAALEEIKYHAFEAECAGVGAFPSKETARAVWAGVACKELEELALQVRKKMREVGFAEDRPFSPHITIARCKFPSNVTEFVNKNSEKRWHDGRWKVDSFSLIESVHTLGGREHNEIRKFMLK